MWFTCHSECIFILNIFTEMFRDNSRLHFHLCPLFCSWKWFRDMAYWFMSTIASQLHTLNCQDLERRQSLLIKRQPCKKNKQTKTIPVKINYRQIASGKHTWESKRTIMCKSPTNNSLASSDSSMWSKEEKTKSYSILCQEFVSVFLPKIELIPAGYPCVGWLLLLTRRYSTQMPANMASTSCLWLYAGILPPDEKKEAQNGVSTSAILGLLQNAITTFAFWLCFFFFPEAAPSG